MEQQIHHNLVQTDKVLLLLEKLQSAAAAEVGMIKMEDLVVLAAEEQIIQEQLEDLAYNQDLLLVDMEIEVEIVVSQALMAAVAAEVVQEAQAQML
jgi:hypothetical protein